MADKRLSRTEKKWKQNNKRKKVIELSICLFNFLYTHPWSIYLSSLSFCYCYLMILFYIPSDMFSF